MKNLIKIISLSLILMLSTSIMANNITVSNVSLEGQNLTDHYCYVEFNLSWENSWRNTTIPNNWDAAWVFIKYNVASSPWYHGTLHGSGHVSAAGSTIDAATDSIGVFVYRSADGSGTNSWINMRLRWDYGADGVADDAVIKVAVVAVEMVYIPHGNFYLGDSTSTNCFYEYPTVANPYQVTSAAITFNSSAGNLWARGSIDGNLVGATFSPDYPSGYDAFYCMKYELSQEQYVGFLNLLTRTQQNRRTETDVSGTSLIEQTWVMSDDPVPSDRNGITCPYLSLGTDPITFYHGDGSSADGLKNTACNFVEWTDMAAYADWAGLRPMTGFEFEKACRGLNLPVKGEYAWGNTLLYSSDYTATFDGEHNESISNPSQSSGNMMWSSTAGNFQGPGRCGIFVDAAVNPTRMETGATYYGVMEMSGNLKEYVVSTLWTSGSSFTGLHGDGALTSEGDANTDYWPGINGNTSVTTANTTYSTAGVTGSAGACLRTGWWDQDSEFHAVSYRNFAGSLQTDDINRTYGNGIRLVHTAP